MPLTYKIAILAVSAFRKNDFMTTVKDDLGISSSPSPTSFSLAANTSETVASQCHLAIKTGFNSVTVTVTSQTSSARSSLDSLSIQR